MDEQKEKKCNYCKVVLPMNKFSKNRAEKYLKSCNECRIKQKAVRAKTKCEHNRVKNQCKDCGGSSICEHDHQRSSCKDCGGSSICEHDHRRSDCKDCGGSSICEHNRMRSGCKQCSGPVKVTIRNWISHSRTSDKKRNRYDADNFIDKCFLKGLVEDSPNCYYCKIKMQYILYHQDDLATIERINNTIGHTKSNCVIACRKCNFSCVGDTRENFRSRLLLPSEEKEN